MAGRQAGLHVFVFDSRRGNREEDEHEKVLAYFPEDFSRDDQATSAGLLQGMSAFASNFGPACRWTSVGTSTSLWLAYEAEPSIYFVLVAPKAWLPRHASESNLRAALVQCHLLAALLSGSVQRLLDQDASGAASAAALAPLLQLFSRQLSSSVSLQQRRLRNPLTNPGMVPTTSLSQQTSLAVQALCARLCAGSSGGCLPLAGLVALHGKYLLWSTLQPRDTVAAYTLASLAILPASSMAQRAGIGDRALSSLAQSSTWTRLPSGHIVVDGGMPGSAAVDCGNGAGYNAPLLFLEDGQRRYCVPYLDGGLLLLLLLDGSAAPPLALRGLQPLLASDARQLAAQVAEELRSEPSHKRGVRYMVEDVVSSTVKASPRRKISAMSHHARAVATSLKDSMLQHGAAEEEWAEAAPEPGGTDGSAAAAAAPEGRRPTEVVVKSSQDCWAASRSSAGRQAYIVCEKRLPSSTRGAVAHLDGLFKVLSE